MARVNDANQEGITPIGQAFISRNIQAIKGLLKLGANLHAKCVIDRSVTRKMMTPLHYFVKRIRVQPFNKIDNEIIEVLVKKNIKA